MCDIYTYVRHVDIDKLVATQHYYSIYLQIACFREAGINNKNFAAKMSHFVNMEVFSNYQKYIDNEQELREVGSNAR